MRSMKIFEMLSELCSDRHRVGAGKRVNVSDDRVYHVKWCGRCLIRKVRDMVDKGTSKI